MFWRFCMCSSNDTFDKKKILMSVLGLNSNDRKSTGEKANINNPKVNRCCAPLTANRISVDCVQISPGPSIPYTPPGLYHTGRFNAISHATDTVVTKKCFLREWILEVLFWITAYVHVTETPSCYSMCYSRKVLTEMGYVLWMHMSTTFRDYNSKGEEPD